MREYKGDRDELLWQAKLILALSDYRREFGAFCSSVRAGKPTFQDGTCYLFL